MPETQNRLKAHMEFIPDPMASFKTRAKPTRRELEAWR